MSKPSIPQGTRDFSPGVMVKRKFIFKTIIEVFESYGFMPLETPAMENLSTLTGKYGDEGDKLLFKILNNGDYLKDIDLTNAVANTLTRKIADRGLRYDLTVPLARFVVMNRNELSFPFKRYQVQPVWRADRPQKGRYREFWQCDADVLGSDSILCEAEFVRIYQKVFNKLGLHDYEIRVNHRKLLEAVTEMAEASEYFRTITVIIDKADKIGTEGVKKELETLGLHSDRVDLILSMLQKEPLSPETLTKIENRLKGSKHINKAIEDLKQLMLLTSDLDIPLFLDGSLARGLDYYTGCIFEVVAGTSHSGSLSGGGRYDNLTGVFGLNGVSGMGISFGVDRIYDLLEDLKIFPGDKALYTDVLFCPMNEEAIKYCIPLAEKLREKGCRTEIFPGVSKLKKQLDYANDKSITWAIIVGDDEMKLNKAMIKNLESGKQELIDIEDIEKFVC